MNYWFTSDLHLGHGNILTYDERPFSSVEEMDETLIASLNKEVKSNDYLYFLGDFCLPSKVSAIIDYVSRINCKRIFFVRGNHDAAFHKNKNELLKYFETIDDYKEVKIDNKLIVLCHYAFRVWRKSHYGSFHCFGHSHGNLKDDPHALSYDVGVDHNNYRPISFEELKEIMSKKDWQPVDHHVRDME
jgi:calcineurin-like phosphoesterase family protein